MGRRRQSWRQRNARIERLRYRGLEGAGGWNGERERGDDGRTDGGTKWKGEE